MNNPGVMAIKLCFTYCNHNKRIRVEINFTLKTFMDLKTIFENI